LHKKDLEIMQMVAMTGLSYPAVRATIDLFVACGWSAIRPANWGRNQGEGRSLSEVQEVVIHHTIIDNRPEQLKMDFCLWRRSAVGPLIEQEYGIKLHVRSVYPKRWGFTPQKPIKRAYEQSSEAVQAWLEGEYPAIEQRAKRESAEIHWDRPFYSHSPQFNPEERLNADLKQEMGTRVPVRTKVKLREAASAVYGNVGMQS
jgi:transposase